MNKTAYENAIVLARAMREVGPRPILVRAWAHFMRHALKG
jgi:hypothetical protein